MAFNIPVSLKFIASIAVVLETFTRLPPQLIYRSKLPKFPNFSDETSLLLILPGAGGPDANTEFLLHQVKSQDVHLGLKRSALVYDWSPWRGNLLRAAYDSQEVGIRIAKILLEYPQLKHLHIIGISVGAFAADSVSKTYKQGKGKGHVHLTLLDPFCSKGVIPNSSGVDNFGKSADYCEHYLNTDDPVPFTNTPLRQAVVYDVTSAKARANFTPLPNDNMHSWPGITTYKQYVIFGLLIGYF